MLIVTHVLMLHKFLYTAIATYTQTGIAIHKPLVQQLLLILLSYSVESLARWIYAVICSLTI